MRAALRLAQGFREQNVIGFEVASRADCAVNDLADIGVFIAATDSAAEAPAAAQTEAPAPTEEGARIVGLVVRGKSLEPRVMIRHGDRWRSQPGGWESVVAGWRPVPTCL